MSAFLPVRSDERAGICFLTRKTQQQLDASNEILFPYARPVQHMRTPVSYVVGSPLCSSFCEHFF